MSEDPNVNLSAWGSWKLTSPAPCPAPQVAPRNPLYNDKLKKDPQGTRLLRQGGSRGWTWRPSYSSIPKGALLSALTCPAWSSQQLRADRQADQTDGWLLGIWKPAYRERSEGGRGTKDNNQPRLTEVIAALRREEGEKAKRQVCAAPAPPALKQGLYCAMAWGRADHFLMQGTVCFSSLKSIREAARPWGSKLQEPPRLSQPQAGQLVNFSEDPRL